MIKEMVGQLFKPRVNDEGVRKIEDLINHLSEKEFISKLINKFANINGTIRYATDIDSNTIIWANEQAKTIYGDNITGKKCYDVFYDQCVDCSMCTNETISENQGSINTTIRKSDKTNQTYLVRDVIFIVDDKNIRFEEAINITPYVELIKRED